MFEWLRRTIRKTSSVSASESEPRPAAPPAQTPLSVKDQARQKYAHRYIGRIVHYYPKIGVGILKLEKGRLKVGDTIYLQGNKTRFKQTVGSIEYNHQKVKEVGPGHEVGVRFGARVRQDDDVYVFSS